MFERDPAPRPADPSQAGPAPQRGASTTLLMRHEGGYAAQGPGFYVWDRDAAEVIRVAEALVAGRPIGSRSARFMMIGDGESKGL
jgi:hypothetical protein